MDANDLKKIMSANIKIQLKRNSKTQTDLANDLNIPETTVSNWINAKTYPRVDKIQAMADYFKIKRSDLTEKNKNSNLFISEDEIIFLIKYRNLDEIGKYTVDTTLDAQYKRCVSSELRAAHIDDTSEEQMKLLKEDLDEL